MPAQAVANSTTAPCSHPRPHEGRFGVEHRGHGVFRFTRPDGEVISDTVPRVVLEGCPMDLIVQSNHARVLSIDDRTGVCQWDGVPMDASMAIVTVIESHSMVCPVWCSPEELGA